MTRVSCMLAFAAALIVQCCCARAQPGPSPPTSARAWADKLVALNTTNSNWYLTIQQFVAEDPELVYTVLKSDWGRIKDLNVRTSIVGQLLQGTGSRVVNGVELSRYSPNPHLLDVLELVMRPEPGAQDPNNPRGSWEAQQIRQELLGIAFRPIDTSAELAEWRRSQGDRPLDEIVKESCRRAVATLKTGSPEEKVKLLDLMLQITFYNSYGMSSNNGKVTKYHSGTGLMKLRRDALSAIDLPAVLDSLMKPENPEPIRRKSLQVLARFRPEDEVVVRFEKELSRELPLLIDRPDEPADPRQRFVQPENVADLLTAFSSDWAADLFAKALIKSVASATPNYNIMNAMQGLSNPRLIPTLIALVDSIPDAGAGSNPFDNALRNMTQVGWVASRDGIHDSTWWRLWWHDNRSRYAPEVRSVPIPKIPLRRTTLSAIPTVTRRRAERETISEDPDRAYWLISPGTSRTLLTQNDRAAISNSGLKRLAAVKPDMPGLVVLVLDRDSDDVGNLDEWLDLCDALNRRYYVAVAISPVHGSADPAAHWPTRMLKPAPSVTVEALAEQIVQKITLESAVDRDRIYLAADGKAGTAGYSCALQKQTPFRGFALFSAPFRSAQIPSPAAAKGRRFYLGLGLQGAGGLDALAVAAEPILRQNGAVVQSERIKSGTLADGIQAAVRWLEH